MAIGIATWIICNYIHSFFPDTFFTVILTSLISVVILLIFVFSFGLSSVERSIGDSSGMQMSLLCYNAFDVFVNFI